MKKSFKKYFHKFFFVFFCFIRLMVKVIDYLIVGGGIAGCHWYEASRDGEASGAFGKISKDRWTS